MNESKEECIEIVIKIFEDGRAEIITNTKMELKDVRSILKKVWKTLGTGQWMKV